MNTAIVERLCIIGLGLIGSSIGRAAYKHKLAGRIIACDSNELSLAYAKREGFVDDTTTDPAQAVLNCDMVILAAPPSTLEDITIAIAPSLKSGVIVMDACSVKLPAIAGIEPHLPEHAHFMPAHPIAGSEQAGVAAGKADLFARKRVVITPKQASEDETLKTVTAFWSSMGAKVEAMPAHLHDMIYAYVSHLPQLLSFATAEPLADYAQDKSIKQFMRLTGSPASLWLDIFLLNHENVSTALARYLDALVHIRKELNKAPEGSDSIEDKALIHTALFPRIVASCLITTVMEAEKKAGFPFARYAGSGFADFSSPATKPPEDDIERISGQYKAVAALLEKYEKRLKKFHTAIENGDAKKLMGLLS